MLLESVILLLFPQLELNQNNRSYQETQNNQVIIINIFHQNQVANKQIIV